MDFKNKRIHSGNVVATIIMLTVAFTYILLVVKPQSVYAPFSSNYVEKPFGADETEVWITSVVLDSILLN